jgi:BirA family transcriptional regulator, biotin operon repressor / biotin---[acetyl-CoA-carboxylase] ligase
MALDLDSVLARLPGRKILWLESTDSTMLDTARLAAAGCPSGAVVGAEEQTGGQGRFGRKWHSEPRSGLYFSIVLRLDMPAETLPIATLALGLATAEAIANATGLAPDLRWPNDVLLNDRKCAGILVQLNDSALITGIGVNVNHAAFPEDIAPLATSLRLASGREHSREDLLVELLTAIDRLIMLFAERGKEPILDLFSRASSYVYGRRVIVEQGGQPAIGTTDGLDANGFLYLRRDDGTRNVIMAGGVRPWKAAP